MPLAQPAPSVATTAFAHLYHKLSSHDRFPPPSSLLALAFVLHARHGLRLSLVYRSRCLSRPGSPHSLHHPCVITIPICPVHSVVSTKFPFISWQSCRTLGFFYNQLLLLLSHSNSHLQHALHLISASSRGCVTQARAARRFKPFYF